MLSRHLAVAVAAMTIVVAAGCSSSREVIGPVEGFSESHLAGRFAATEPIIRSNGTRIVADTLELGTDRSVKRYFYVENDAGVVAGAWHGGGYQIRGDSIRIAYSTTSSGGYGLFDIVDMAVLGTSSRVTRLQVGLPGGTVMYDRVRSR